MTGISNRWKKIASGVLGIESGKHCHWCKHMISKDGSVTCGNPDSPFHDGDRIRTWDGKHCAERCPVFELDDWYKKDSNIERSFEIV
jgi:hypothetical protein